MDRRRIRVWFTVEVDGDGMNGCGCWNCEMDETELVEPCLAWFGTGVCGGGSAFILVEVGQRRVVTSNCGSGRGDRCQHRA